MTESNAQPPLSSCSLRQKLTAWLHKKRLTLASIAIIVVALASAAMFMYYKKSTFVSTSEIIPSPPSTPTEPIAKAPHTPDDFLGGIHHYLSAATKKMASASAPASKSTSTTEPSPDAVEAAPLLIPQETKPVILPAKIPNTLSEKTISQLIFITLDLQESLEQGTSYTKELQALARFSSKYPDLKNMIALLEPNAPKGLSTRTELQHEFSALANNLTTEDIKNNSDSNWTQKILSYLFSYVSIHRINPHAIGSDTQAIIARSAAYMKEGDIASATEEMAHLQNEAATYANFWLSDARAYLKAHFATNHLLESLRNAIYSEDMSLDNISPPQQ